MLTTAGNGLKDMDIVLEKEKLEQALGLTLAARGTELRVASVTKGSATVETGLQVNDLIAYVNGIDVRGMQRSKLVQHLLDATISRPADAIVFREGINELYLVFGVLSVCSCVRELISVPATYVLAVGHSQCQFLLVKNP
jgi:predicted metalloprotease with PDZ domain